MLGILVVGVITYGIATYVMRERRAEREIQSTFRYLRDNQVAVSDEPGKWKLTQSDRQFHKELSEIVGILSGFRPEEVVNVPHVNVRNSERAVRRGWAQSPERDSYFSTFDETRARLMELVRSTSGRYYPESPFGSNFGLENELTILSQFLTRDFIYSYSNRKLERALEDLHAIQGLIRLVDDHYQTGRKTYLNWKVYELESVLTGCVRYSVVDGYWEVDQLQQLVALLQDLETDGSTGNGMRLIDGLEVVGYLPSTNTTLRALSNYSTSTSRANLLRYLVQEMGGEVNSSYRIPIDIDWSDFMVMQFAKSQWRDFYASESLFVQYCIAVRMFRETNGRWPRDREEITGFGSDFAFQSRDVDDSIVLGQKHPIVSDNFHRSLTLFAD